MPHVGDYVPSHLVFTMSSEINVPDIIPYLLMKRSLEVESPGARRPRAFVF